MQRKILHLAIFLNNYEKRKEKASQSMETGNKTELKEKEQRWEKALENFWEKRGSKQNRTFYNSENELLSKLKWAI